MDSVNQKIADLLEQSIGLTVSSIGDSTFQRALNNRKKILDIADQEAYLEKLTVSYMEMRRLVEEVVVPETWFFRDQEPFNYLTDYVHRSPKSQSGDIFRLLSIPCSTGEEPYSMAITLLQAGLKPSSFFIDAVDVSSKSLSTARIGVYRSNSFRTKDLKFRDNFFHKIEDSYSLNSRIRDKVRFIQGNILQPGFIESLGLYDVVFCRNLLIYFNKEAQDKAIKGLYDMLFPNGLLFTGHSEASLFMGNLFLPASHSRAFAFHKQVAKGEVSFSNGRNAFLSNGDAMDSESPIQVRRSRFAKKRKPVASKQEEKDEFAKIQELADEGEIDEAARLCEIYLKQLGPSAKLYYLLGILRENQGQTEEAKKCFRRAVYLDPGNVESLTQLALMAEKAGDIETAENYKRRARINKEKP